MHRLILMTILAIVSSSAIAELGKSDDNGNDKHKAVCLMSEYAAIFKRTSCVPNEITSEQLVDSSKITQSQKYILLKWRAEANAIAKESRELLRRSGDRILRGWADYLDSINPKVDSYNQDLFNGVITWGEYNHRRVDAFEKGQVEWFKRKQPTHDEGINQLVQDLDPCAT